MLYPGEVLFIRGHMTFSKKMRFQKIIIGILILFSGLMLIVTTFAYSRRSGNTGIDMAKIHLMRHAAQQESSAKLIQ